MELKTDDYCIRYDADSKIIHCQGMLRLAGMGEYAPMIQLLDQALDNHPPTLVLDLKHLEYLNSSGINVLSKFVIKVRQQENVKLIVQGSKDIPWQGKSLKNLQRLMPSLELTWE
jgi:hypothetical protein